MSVIRDDAFVFTVTDGGFAKRTPVSEYRVQGRGGLGIKAMKLVDERGALAGALVADATDEVLAVTSNGGVIRSRVDQVNATGRDTMGVRYMNLAEGDAVLTIARNAEREIDDTDDDDADLDGAEDAAADAGPDGAGGAPVESDLDGAAGDASAGEPSVGDASSDAANGEAASENDGSGAGSQA
jgi:DNA gyrase subunit A